MAGVSGTDVVVSSMTRALPDRIVRLAVHRVLRGERSHARIDVTFLGPEGMRQLNDRFLRHKRPTDVLAFPLRLAGGGLAGDVYVCRFVAARNAREHGVPVREELLRLIVHGTLHIVGWDHPAGSARTRSAMWRRQERYLAELA